ncbi:MAG: hypothetical protein ACXVCY_06655 [Pseudobdellovibrionaceae bacterium]
MSTINPLFLDSTKPIGDKVVTNVELGYILLHDGDSLYFEMTNEFGFIQKFALKAVETKKSVKYKAEVWLKYQHQIHYRFIIESEGVELFSSAKRETRAGHIISEKWEPFFDSEPATAKEEKRSSRQTSPGATVDTKQPRENRSHSTKPLCKPQFFEQIRSLIDDLL